MPSLTQELMSQKVVDAPSFLKNNVMYECYMGSVAYGVSGDMSDIDVYGFAIPSKECLFPHLYGYIHGFGPNPPKFDQYIKHGIQYKEKEYDITIYNIVKYFNLVAGGNPNMIDSVFVPYNMIRHSTRVGEMVRENRHMFLSKLCYPAFKGYAYRQLHKAKHKKPEPCSKRYESYMTHGFDVKYAYHLIRLIDEIDQILSTEDLDLQRNREELKAIRRGDLTLQEIENLAEIRETRLEKLFANSKMREKPDYEALKNLLMRCIEEHYGKIDNAIVNPDKYFKMVQEIRKIVDAH